MLNDDIEFQDMAPDDQQKVKQLMSHIIPVLLVNYQLDSLYLEDPRTAMGKLSEILDAEQPLDQREAIIISHSSYGEEKNKFLGILDQVSNEHFENYAEMYLFQTVAIFERMVNDFLASELVVKYGFTYSKAADRIISKLSTDDKLDWFLNIVSGKTFTSEYAWGKIKPLIDARNFFIHFKPISDGVYRKHRSRITKSSLKDFLEAGFLCYKFLENSRSQEQSDYLGRIERIRTIFELNNFVIKEL